MAPSNRSPLKATPNIKKQSYGTAKDNSVASNSLKVPLTLLSIGFLLISILLANFWTTPGPEPAADYTAFFLNQISTQLPRSAWPVSMAAEGERISDAHQDNPMKGLLAALDTMQHPPKDSCRSRRLLLTQFSATNFEGSGSLLKVVMLALAEAAHSNRTLIWGLDLSYTWEHTRDLWQNGIDEDDLKRNRSDSERSTSNIRIGNQRYDCSGWKTGGGPHSCFFLPLSTCSLEDVTESELLSLAKTGHQDTARVKVAEPAVRGVSAYHPPYLSSLFAPIFFTKDIKQKVRFPRHTWAAALAKYVFRLKPAVEAAFETEQKEIWTNAGADPQRRPIWAMHVRHGDVAALEDIYPNRKVFTFSSYLERTLSKAYQDDSLGLLRPAALFVASDSIDIHSNLEQLNSPTAGFQWPYPAPPIFSNDRIRSKHGSHTESAEGGCLAGASALPAGTVIALRQQAERDAVPRSLKMARVIAECLADLWILSKADWLVTQGSSHFSSLGVLLVWARLAESEPWAWNPLESAVLMDEAELQTGEAQTAFIHGSWNQSTRLGAAEGWTRWAHRTKRVVPGLFGQGMRTPVEHPVPGFNPAVEGYRMKQHELLPFLPHATLYLEAARWASPVSTPILWPNECPHSRGKDVALQQYVGELINLGADHSELHFGEAMKCWFEAERPMKAAGDGADEWNEYKDVVKGNVEALGLKQLYPYSMGRDKVLLFRERNFGIPREQ